MCETLWLFWKSFNFTRQTLRMITTIQVAVNEKKHDLSMLVYKNLRSVIAIITFLRGIFKSAL